MAWIMLSPTRISRNKTKITKQLLQGILIGMTVLSLRCDASTYQIEACGQEELASCAKPLAALAETSELSIIANREDLEKLCPDLRTGIECIRSYTRRCMDMDQRDHFNTLYEPTHQMVKDLCEDENYKEDYLRHTPCMHMIKDKYEKCGEKYQQVVERITKETSTTTTTTKSPWTSDLSNYVVIGRDTVVQQISEENATTVSPIQENIKQICCAFQEYMECSEKTVLVTCGHDTAKFTRKFLDRMGSQLIKMHCDNYDRLCPSWVQSTASELPMKSTIFVVSIVSLVVSLFIVVC